MNFKKYALVLLVSIFFIYLTCLILYNETYYENKLLYYDSSVNLINDNDINIKINGDELTLTDYLIGVVASEMPASFHIEALKSQAIISRTYALKKINNNITLTGTTSDQVYNDIETFKDTWGDSYEYYKSIIKTAVVETNGILVFYEDDLIESVFHSSSNGNTQNAVDVWGNDKPYLVTVASNDTNTKNYSYTTTLNYEEQSIIDKTSLIDISRNNQGYVDKIKINDFVYTGIEFRQLFNLKSSDFEINLTDTEIIITTSGYGHGVGLSQYGANEMAKEGNTYDEIITHYYTGVTLKNSL